ncbi:hypothetical protein [Sulfuricurvum sp.]|uniref:hypothetical protein n=1 Tax=Sulfuricurvum sp. TaxID=2025608 RepID=UPI0035615F12
MDKTLIPDKLILDACCGGKFFWLDKHHPDTLYIDIRKEDAVYAPERPHFKIQPDMQLDYRDLPFADKSFKLIVWDPPHMLRENGMTGLSGNVIRKYGALHADTWRDDLKRGFNELWRVLDDNGTLIFKFCDREAKFEDVLKLFHTKPLFGTVTHKDRGETKWFCFFKSPGGKPK